LEVERVLNEYSIENSDVLEIGCGDGYWTMKWLLPRFERITTIDLIERPTWFTGLSNINHITLPEASYDLPGIKDSSVGFVWSFGVFCHFTNKAIEEYLKSVYRVMLHGAYAVIMFANWEKHPDFKDKPAEYGIDPEPFCGWTCGNLDTIIKQIEDAGLCFVKDSIPEFRDTLAIMRKL
jgi:cyclopropane fatty-acyl-phospholipid synthase-like methyltransferase